MNVSFNISTRDQNTIKKIVDRAVVLNEALGIDTIDRISLAMDLTAVHANCMQLDLVRLLEAEAKPFLTEIHGIRQNINRQTGQLMNQYLPKFIMGN